MADKTKIYDSEVSIQNKAALLMICVAQEVQNKIHDLLKEYDISFTQLSILHILDEQSDENLTVNQIRELMSDDSPNVSRSLNKLAAKDLVVKERSKEDQRVVYIALTNAGKKLHHKCDRRVYGKNLLDLPEADARNVVEMLMNV